MGPILSASASFFCSSLNAGEVTGARWDEFDLDKKLWVIPQHRIKARREHRVPLSDVKRRTQQSNALFLHQARSLPRRRGGFAAVPSVEA
jgi:integrase